ncbi:uncharacterized protein LOC131027415 [Cryptomeria japonica]|uniref:uncharacterized protein LOC131027415 n=1 Tax=Cryptomeria japonica TaxID=3369 RepID=UPI0027DA3A13|nr:uncharacterized protein LOC131027415 [Cryptomeria japonica]
MMERKALKPLNLSTTAPSSPGRKSNSNISEDYYFSEPTSPTHFLKADQLDISICGNDLRSKAVPFAWEEKGTQPKNDDIGFDFGVSSRYSEADADLVSAEELFYNGQIRPLNQQVRGFDLRAGRIPCPPRPSGSKRVMDSDSSSSTKIKGRASLRNFLLEEEGSNQENVGSDDRFFRIHEGIKETKCKDSRSFKKWSFKDFLYRSSSDGSKDRLWGFAIIPPAKQAQKHSMTKKNKRETARGNSLRYDEREIGAKSSQSGSGSGRNSKKVVDLHHKQSLRYDEREMGAKSLESGNGSGSNSKKVVDLHYKQQRIQVEGGKKKSFLPYRNGLLGCLGFTSNSYSGLSRSLSPFS